MFNETSYNLGDYVRSGARWMYQASVSPASSGVSIPIFGPVGGSSGNCNGLRSAFSGGLVVTSFGCDRTNGSINMQGEAHMDFSDENDVKSIIDGAVQSNGFTLKQSMFRMISNPGGGSSNPMVPPAAGREPGATPDKSWLDTAGEFWGDFASDVGGKLLPTTGAGAGMSIGLILAIGIGIFVFAKVLR